MPSNNIYLGIGSVLTESVKSKLATEGLFYQHKLLNSKPENWRIIADMLQPESVVAAIVKLTGNDYERICSDKYSAIAELLFSRLSATQNLILVHENVAGYPQPEVDESSTKAAVNGEDDEYQFADMYNYDWNDQLAREHFGYVGDDVRRRVHDLLDRHGLEITTYKRNAEASMLATGFLDDMSSNLLFRLYIPAGRIYEDEFARLLQMFHDWLGSVVGRNVRQDGYKTSNGRVIEYYGEPGFSRDDWSTDLAQFSEFLKLVEDRDATVDSLCGMGLGRDRAEELAARYRRDARRILIDTRHDRERRILQIRQELEDELSDEVDVPTTILTELIDQLVPDAPVLGSPTLVRPTALSSRTHSAGSVVINNQFFHRVEGVVAQNLAGPVKVGASLEQVIEIIRSVGGPDADRQQIAARELADPGAPVAARFRARQLLKSFLVRNVARIEQAAFDLGMKWIEGQIGV